MNNIFAVTVLTLALTLPSQAQQIFATNTKQRIRVVTVATGLVHPWSIAFLPDGRTMLVAERAGRVLFGPGTALYVTVGERGRLGWIGTDDNSRRIKAQSLDKDVGKVLRIRDDGSVPPNSPFVGRKGASPEIYTYGHRNGYGLA